MASLLSPLPGPSCTNNPPLLTITRLVVKEHWEPRAMSSSLLFTA